MDPYVKRTCLLYTSTEADNPQADILWSGTIGTVKNKSEYFADYTTSNEDAFYDEYKNTEGNLCLLYTST